MVNKIKRDLRGQEIRFFLVRFTGRLEDIKPDPGEIRHTKWVKYDELKDHFNFTNQWKTAQKIIAEFSLQ